MRRLQPHPAPPLLGVRYRTQLQSQADLRRKASSTSTCLACSYPHSCSGTCSTYPYSGTKPSSWNTTILECSPASRTDFAFTLDLQGTLLRGQHCPRLAQFCREQHQGPGSIWPCGPEAPGNSWGCSSSSWTHLLAAQGG